MSDKKQATLEEALKSGVVVLKSEVDKIVNEALEDAKKSLQKQWRAEELKAKKKKQEKSISDRAQSFIDGSGLTDVKFGEKLLAWSVQKPFLSCLRDEHKNFNYNQLWDYIRANYVAKKK